MVRRTGNLSIGYKYHCVQSVIDANKDIIIVSDCLESIMDADLDIIIVSNCQP